MKKSNLGIVCSLLGVVLIVAAALLSLSNFKEENQAEMSAIALRQTVVEATPDLVTLDPLHELIPNYVLDGQREMPTVEIDGNLYIGTVDIPALDLSLPVLQEWSYPGLKLSPCRFTGSVYDDDMVIAAHNYKKHFGGLKSLVVGDTVFFTDVDGNVFIYEVVMLEQLQPTQVDEMCSGDWDLTLFTCTLGGQSRVTVRCKLTNETL